MYRITLVFKNDCKQFAIYTIIAQNITNFENCHHKINLSTTHKSDH